VNRYASSDDIQRAYERLKRIYDPSASKKARAAERWQEINEAYEVLSDPRRRSDYDRQRRRRKPATADAEVNPPRSRLGRTTVAVLGSPFLFAGMAVSAATIGLIAIVLISVIAGGDEALVAVPTGSPPASSLFTPGPTASATPARPTLSPNPPGKEVVSATGLKYIDIKAGSGASPQPGQKMIVNYVGWLAKEKTQFDNGTAVQFDVGGLIPGFNEGVATMKVGGQRRLIIPPDIGYKDSPPAGSGIPAGATLVFDVELVELKDTLPATP